MTEIVLLDDDPFMLRLLRHILAHLGYRRVVACESGASALEEIGRSSGAVDLILLDMNMPGMDGVEFIRRLVECRYAGSVILVSGEDHRTLESVEKLIEAHEMKALGHLQKPVKPAELAALLRRLTPNTGPGRPTPAGRHTYDARALRRALARGEFVNYYQPKVALGTGEVVGMESLVRWQHPVDGLVQPGEFIEFAASFDMIVDITEGVLSAAMQHLRAWADSGHAVPMAVNVSMDDLMALEFPDRAEAMARAMGIESRLITFEVTEGQVMRQPRTVLDVLTRLRLKRFRLAIDDFGTGHSSLAQLRDLPFDELKIDRGFVHGAAVDATRSAICQASLRMAQQLRMQVVGEGIEDQEDWDYLRGLGCEVGQGYFIARPMPAERVLDWLVDWDSRRPAGAGLTA